MTRLLPFAVFVAAIVSTNTSVDAVGKDAGSKALPAAVPEGKWTVEFANGVTETCAVTTMDGYRAFVAEPNRSSPGVVAIDGGSAVLTFDDDRVERWTPVGDRFVVEHWFPAAGFGSARPVLGIAQRAGE
jgi:hypothetical protein